MTTSYPSVIRLVPQMACFRPRLIGGTLRIHGEELRALEVVGGWRVRPPLDQPPDVPAVELVDVSMRDGVLPHPEVLRMNRLLVHPAEDLGPKVFHPVG